jgi:hypothetical protein
MEYCPKGSRLVVVVVVSGWRWKEKMVAKGLLSLLAA